MEASFRFLEVDIVHRLVRPMNTFYSPRQASAYDSRYSLLIDAIKSVIFMGTPHRGFDVASWSKIYVK